MSRCQRQGLDRAPLGSVRRMPRSAGAARFADAGKMGMAPPPALQVGMTGEEIATTFGAAAAARAMTLATAIVTTTEPAAVTVTRRRGGFLDHLPVRGHERDVRERTIRGTTAMMVGIGATTVDDLIHIVPTVMAITTAACTAMAIASRVRRI